ncbi:MAG: hypothetical protein WD403_09590 [Pirellulales bacterium]
MSADRNLLFGILALQMDFISRDELIAAMHAWVLDKSNTLGEILVAQEALERDTQVLLDSLVEKHLALHDRDPAKSLAAIAALGSCWGRTPRGGLPQGAATRRRPRGMAESAGGVSADYRAHGPAQAVDRAQAGGLQCRA